MGGFLGTTGRQAVAQRDTFRWCKLNVPMEQPRHEGETMLKRLGPRKRAINKFDEGGRGNQSHQRVPDRGILKVGRGPGYSVNRGKRYLYTHVKRARAVRNREAKSTR